MHIALSRIWAVIFCLRNERTEKRPFLSPVHLFRPEILPPAPAFAPNMPNILLAPPPAFFPPPSSSSLSVSISSASSKRFSRAAFCFFVDSMIPVRHVFLDLCPLVVVEGFNYCIQLVILTEVDHILEHFLDFLYFEIAGSTEPQEIVVIPHFKRGDSLSGYPPF